MPQRLVPASKPVKAAWPVVRFQNMPSRKVANSGALTKRENELQEVHHVVELRRQIRGADGEHNADDRGHAADPQIVLVVALSGGCSSDKCRKSKPC